MTKEAGWPERRRGHAAGALGSDRSPLTAAHQRSPWPLGVRLGAGRPCRLPQPGDGVGPLRGAARSCGAGAESGASPAARGRPA